MALKLIENETDVIFPCGGEIRKGKVCSKQKMSSGTNLYYIRFTDCDGNRSVCVKDFSTIPLNFIKENKVGFEELLIFCEICGFLNEGCYNYFLSFADSVASHCLGGNRITIYSNPKEIEVIKNMYKKVCKTILIFKDWILEFFRRYLYEDRYNQFVNDFDKFFETTQYLN